MLSIVQKVQNFESNAWADILDAGAYRLCCDPFDSCVVNFFSFNLWNIRLNCDTRVVLPHSLRELIDQDLTRASQPLIVAIMQLNGFWRRILGYLGRDVLFRHFVPFLPDNKFDFVDKLVKVFSFGKGDKYWQLLNCILAEEKLDKTHNLPLDVHFSNNYLFNSLKKEDFFRI